MKFISFLCFLLTTLWFLSPLLAIAQSANETNDSANKAASIPATDIAKSQSISNKDAQFLEERLNFSQDEIREIRNSVNELRQNWIGGNEKILKRLDDMLGEIESLKIEIGSLKDVKKSTSNDLLSPEAIPTKKNQTQNKARLSDKEQYQQAYQHLVDKQLPLARKAMQQFLHDYPQSRLADNAAYWIGETYFAEKNYIKASQQFSSAFETYPESNKAPDNLLKLGLSLLRLDKKDESCVTLFALLERYPNAPVYITDRANDIITNAPCQPS